MPIIWGMSIHYQEIPIDVKTNSERESENSLWEHYLSLNLRLENMKDGRVRGGNIGSGQVSRIGSPINPGDRVYVGQLGDETFFESADDGLRESGSLAVITYSGTGSNADQINWFCEDSDKNQSNKGKKSIEDIL